MFEIRLLCQSISRMADCTQFAFAKLIVAEVERRLNYDFSHRHKRRNHQNPIKEMREREVFYFLTVHSFT